MSAAPALAFARIDVAVRWAGAALAHRPDPMQDDDDVDEPPVRDPDDDEGVDEDDEDDEDDGIELI